MRFVVPLLLLACGVEQEADVFAADLLAAPTIRGCHDAEFALSNPADSRAIFVSVSGLASRAHIDPSGHTSGTASLPAPSVQVRGQEGSMLTSATCVGIPPQPGPQVDHMWTAVSGNVTYEATALPGPAGVPLAAATVVIRNLVLENDDTGAQLTFRRLRFNDIEVGFYAP